MTIEQIVSAIRSLPVQERRRVIALVEHDVAADVSGGEAEPAPGITLIERHGFLVAHGESRAALSEEVFDHRRDRDARAELLWGGS